MIGLILSGFRKGNLSDSPSGAPTKNSMENSARFCVDLALNIVIFHGYVCLLEGIPCGIYFGDR